MITGPDLKKLGEFGLIKRIQKMAKQKRAILGIGDDCAVAPYTKDKYLLLTVDMLIEGVHFDLKKAGPKRVGRKALAVSLSDIAAMGGIPKYCLISQSAPSDASIKMIDDFYSGFLKLADEYGVELIGGDTNRSDKFIFDVCVIGEVEKKYLTRRGGAKVGDKIYVTGRLGGSIKGRQYDFTPRVKEARVLVRDFKVNAMIDVSDGISSDLRHIVESSGVGAVIYEKNIPIAESSSLKDALGGGEDFELLFTMPGDISGKILSERVGAPVKKIGEIRPKKDGVRIICKNGKEAELKAAGYKHF